MDNKILLIDGSNLLFQMYYGMPSRIVNKDGLPVHGVIGFIGAIRKIINITKPSHIVVIFDGEGDNERINIDSQYKANREDYSLLPEEDTPFFQLQYIYKSLDFMKIKYHEVKTGEADDLIASYALRLKNEFNVVISSFDSDFFQLVSENVTVLRYRGKQTVICDKAYIIDKYNIYPEQYADYKSLVGDSSDNIKGLKGIGPKTASKLVSEFGNIENLYLHIDKIEKTVLKNTLIESKNIVTKNQALIKLTDKSEFPFEIDVLEFDFEASMKYTTNEILTINNIL